jgi:putative sigma-54 modulation protein
MAKFFCYNYLRKSQEVFDMKNESTLSIEIFGKNYTVSDGLTNMTLKKCSKLDNYFKDDENARVNFTVTLEGDTYTTDLVVSSHGITYRATAVSDSPYTNLDLVIPKLLGQVRKQKDIWERRGISVDKKKGYKPEQALINEDTRE